ncbi:unnamed protein product [Soboliphyme baturini]|uniref:Uncharacterized protein n=1 Tax=Soboliphyme baturini TaxID=241478 RepID=A0A183JAQ8_9BILA|nr:unnamed protein product [Soboliphyme baturini]
MYIIKRNARVKVRRKISKVIIRFLRFYFQLSF